MSDVNDPDFEPSTELAELVPMPDEPVQTEQFGYLLPGGRVVPLPPGVPAFDAAVGMANYNRINRRTGVDRAKLARRTVEPWAPYEIPKKRPGRPAKPPAAETVVEP